MRLGDRMTQQGQWLFRSRDVVLLVLVPVAVAAIRQSFGAAGSGDRDVAWRVACLGVSLLGLAGRVATVGFAPVGTSGRGRHEPRASRLNTTGMYSIVRNPLYVANFLVVIGIALATRTWWFPALTGLCFALVHERIVLAEEQFLAARFPDEYGAWIASTPAFVPRLSAWRPPDRTFSFRSALRREYMGLANALAGFVAIELLGRVVVQHRPLAAFLAEERAWLWLFAAALLGGLGAWVIKKRTRWLDVPGR